MKRIIVLLSLAIAISNLAAQNVKKTNAEKPATVIQCSEFHITRPLRDIVAEHPFTQSKQSPKESQDRDHNKPQHFVKGVKNGGIYGNDPASMQTTMGTVQDRSPIHNYPGQSLTGMYPLDPCGAAGLTQYVQMINATTFQVMNKSTGAVTLTGTLGNLWQNNTPNDGDPIVLYDKAADRWFLSQFGSSGNKIYIAISATGDATGSYYTYTFTSPEFPDYLKFSVWQDGYYMTSNQNTQRVFAFERTKMLAGNQAARAVYQSFTPPNGGYFFVPLAGDAGDGTLPPAGTPCPIFSYSDNGWGNGFVDAVNIYQVAVNWVPNTPTETITSAGSVNTAAFDASYDSNWNDCPQPGTNQKLDGIGGVCMFRAQWKPWNSSGYNSVVLNWGVKINSTQRSIKWCELHQNQNSGAWTMYQEGIYTPDANTRWMGSIAMDNNGSIALCYLKSNSTNIYPSLCYTGRKSCDPLGTLPITEVVAKAGSGSQTGVNRDGDYSETWLDPDGITFWHTGQYIDGSGNIQTQIYSFQLGSCVTTSPVANFSASPTTICAGSSVQFTDLSTNTPTSWAWSFPGAATTSSTLQNPLIVYNAPGTYSVTLTATNSFGSSAPFTMTNYITVVGAPTTANAGTNQNVCTTTATLAGNTAIVGTGLWTLVSGSGTITTPTSPTSGVTGLGVGANVFRWTISNSPCAASTSQVTITRGAIPTITNSNMSINICSGDHVNFTPTSGVTGSTFAWVSGVPTTGVTGESSNGTGTINDILLNANTTAGTETYTITPTGPSPTFCAGTASTLTVTIEPVTVAPIITVNGSTFTSNILTGNQWYLNGNIIPGATGSTYTATVNGVYTDVVTTNGCPSAHSNSITLSNVGIPDIEGINSISIYPNPSNGIFNIDINSTRNLTINVKIFDVLGQLVDESEIKNFKSTIDLTSKANGMYFIQINCNGSTYNTKIMKR